MDPILWSLKRRGRRAQRGEKENGGFVLVRRSADAIVCVGVAEGSNEEFTFPCLRVLLVRSRQL